MIYYSTSKATLYHADNLEVLRSLPSESVHLVYSDILYNTGNTFKDYVDVLGTPQQAVEWYRPRFQEMRRIMTATASIYIHCDWHLSAYMRVLLDEVFGFDCYKNEIIRQCTNAKNNSRNWGRVYDNILYYTKDPKNYTWNEPREPKNDADLMAQYNKLNAMGERYTTIPLHAKGETKNGATGKPWDSKTHGTVQLPAGRHWSVNPTELDRLDADGLVEWSKNGNPRKILFAKDYMDKPTQNIWDMKSIGGESYFKQHSYDTQKPVELLDRIIRTSSNDGDTVADFFMGSGVTGYVAKSMNRFFIGADINERSLQMTKLIFE